MREQKRILVAKTKPDPEQPRKVIVESELLALGQNMLAVGQLVPVIVYPVLDYSMLLDGQRRWMAAQQVGIKELDAVILPEKPTATVLHLLQMSLDAHRANLSAMERADFLHRIKEENSWSVNDLATNLQMKQPLVSKLLGLQRLCPDARKMLHDGAIDIERAHVVSQEPDHTKQLELLKAATECSREGLRRKARGISCGPKVSSAKFPMPGGYVASLSGLEKFDLSTAAEVFSETARILKKAISNHLTIESQQRVMRDTSKKGAL